MDECKYQRINDIYNSNRYTGLDNIATMVPGIVWPKSIYLRTEK